MNLDGKLLLLLEYINKIPMIPYKINKGDIDQNVPKFKDIQK